MTVHTPGPWFAGAQNDLVFVIAGRAPSMNNDYPVHDAARTVIARIDDSDKGAAETDANAHLIAAAPELLASVKGILAGFEENAFVRNVDEDRRDDWALRFLPYFQALATAAAAIAKAEGPRIEAAP